MKPWLKTIIPEAEPIVAVEPAKVFVETVEPVPEVQLLPSPSSPSRPQSSSQSPQPPLHGRRAATAKSNTLSSKTTLRSLLLPHNWKYPLPSKSPNQLPPVSIRDPTSATSPNSDWNAGSNINKFLFFSHKKHKTMPFFISKIWFDIRYQVIGINDVWYEYDINANFLFEEA